MILPRIVALTAAAVAALGSVSIYVDDRAAGEAVGIGPIVALLAGVVAFAIAVRREPRQDPATGGGPACGIPDGLRIPSPSLRGLRLALVVCAVTTAIYAVFGYNPFVLAGWLGALAVASRALWPERQAPAPRTRLVPAEYWFLGAMMLGFALLVLPYLSTLPYEFSTDEIYSTATVRDFVDGTARDPLGLVRWWGLPALYFAMTALVGNVIGTSIEAVRMVTAFTAIATIVPFYLWVRTLHGRNTATVATLMLAFAHAFIGWGRIALHQNSPVLLLSIAMALLAIGMRDRCPLKILWGGVALGLGFHSYPSGQIMVFIWAAALCATVVLRSVSWRTVAPIAVLSGLGFLLAVAPMIVNMAGGWEAFAARAQAVAISNPAALDLMGQHLGLTDHATILRENVTRGLLSFNGAYPYVTYFNPGHGFVDPATGVLLWLGVALALTRSAPFRPPLVRRRLRSGLRRGLSHGGRPRTWTATGRATVRDGAGRGGTSAGSGGRSLPAEPGGCSGVGSPARSSSHSRSSTSRSSATMPTIRSRGRRSDPVTSIGRALGVGRRDDEPASTGSFGQESGWPPWESSQCSSRSEEYPVFRWADEDGVENLDGILLRRIARPVIVPDVDGLRQTSLPSHLRQRVLDRCDPLHAARGLGTRPRCVTRRVPGSSS